MSCFASSRSFSHIPSAKRQHSPSTTWSPVVAVVVASDPLLVLSAAEPAHLIAKSRSRAAAAAAAASKPPSLTARFPRRCRPRPGASPSPPRVARVDDEPPRARDIAERVPPPRVDLHPVIPRAHARAGLGIGRAVAGTIIASRQIRAIIVTATSARVYSRASPRRRLERERTRLRVLTVVVAVSRASTCAAPTLFGIDARRLEGKRYFHRS